jgi:hypothetical protein
MKYHYRLSILLFLGFPYALFPQLPLHHQLIEELIELIAPDEEAGTDPSLLYDDLMYYILNPVNINKAGAGELRNLYFINELQVANLIEFREAHGEFLTLYELQYIDGFSQDDIRKILPFITIGDQTRAYGLSPADAIRYGSHQYFLRFQRIIQEQKGFSPISESDLAASPNSRYLGSPLKVYTRYQFAYKNQVQAGFVGEKDAGEEFFTGRNPRGFDYNSVHFQVNDVGRFRTIALGDFQSSFGQGLVLWSGLSFGKSANAPAIKKNARGIQKYSSTDENLFFRGAGMTYRLSEKAEASLFVSGKKIDAGISLSDQENKVLEVSSLQNSGLHATPSQVAGRKALGETILGGNLTYNHRNFKIGTTFVTLEYDAVLNPPERIYNQFEFRGTKNSNLGVDYHFSLGSVRFFGEGAMSSSGGSAFLGGAMTNLGPVVSLSGLYRNYSRHYHAYFSNGFRENTRTANEKGFYLGMLFHPVKQWKLSAYFDFFSFPWMRYGAYAPTSGSEYFFQVDYNHSRNLHMYVSYRNKEKPGNAPADESPVRELYDSDASRLRYHVNYYVSPTMEFRNRIEFSRYNSEHQSPERGFMLYQDILYRPQKVPLSFAFRYAIFETESYNARMYAYENDVLYAFSTPAYYDSGFRTYLLAQYSPGKFMDIWVRYAITKLPGRETMGSGLTEISGDARSELKAQVRFRF